MLAPEQASHIFSPSFTLDLAFAHEQDRRFESRRSVQKTIVASGVGTGAPVRPVRDTFGWPGHLAGPGTHATFRGRRPPHHRLSRRRPLFRSHRDSNSIQREATLSVPARVQSPLTRLRSTAPLLATARAPRPPVRPRHGRDRVHPGHAAAAARCRLAAPRLRGVGPNHASQEAPPRAQVRAHGPRTLASPRSLPAPAAVHQVFDLLPAPCHRVNVSQCHPSRSWA